MTKKVAKKVESGSLLPAKLTQADVPALLKQVKDQIAKLKGSIPEENLTKGDIPGFGKISDLKTLEEVIQCASSVIGKEKFYKDAAKVILAPGIPMPPFKIDGMTKDKMVAHLAIKASEVYNQEELKTLTDIQKTLESHLSEEEKLANDLLKVARKLERRAKGESADEE